MKATQKRPLGEMLVEAGVITAQDLKVALEAQKQAPAPLGVTLVQLGMVTEKQLLPFLAQHLSRADVSLDQRKGPSVNLANVTDAVQHLLVQTIERGATDLHLEPAASGLKVRMRIDGILYEIGVPPVLNVDYPAAVSRVKIMCNLDIAEKRLPQDGRTTVKIGQREYDLRVSILPSQFGESIVFRVLQTRTFLSLNELGMPADTLATMEKLLKLRSGLILINGPTGCGKTATIYACLDYLNETSRKIVTIEDPVEYILPGAIQMQVSPAIGLTFGRLLRTVLRHDPNIIMVGEIRDKETAEIAITTALTGHLVLSTIHTNDAASTVARLLDMGIEPFLVASSLSGTLAQRLIRTICKECNGKRCLSCLGIGLKGRVGIFEPLVMDEEIRKLILNRATAEQIREQARKQGMRTLYEDGAEKVKAGQSTPEELERVIHSDA